MVTKEGESLYLALHTHDWEYTASGATITAKCRNTDGACPNRNGGSLTITAPNANDLTYDGSEKTATLADSLTTAAPVTVDDIRYYTGDSLTGSELSANTYPKDAGDYTASITVGGKTASVTYTIAKATPKASDFRFTAPEDLIYDGNAKTAEVWPAAGITGTGNYWVNYYDSLGVRVDPVGVLPASGVYTVKIDVPGGTNYNAIEGLTDESWTFAITPRPVTVTVDAVRRAYGEPNPSFTAQVTGGSLADGQSIEDLNLLLFSVASSRMPVGAYEVTCISQNDNYAVTVDGAGKLTVTPRPVTVSGITAVGKTYDGTTDAALNCSSAVFGNVLEGDTLTVTATGTFADRNVGENKIVAISDLTLGGASASNYQLAGEGQQTEAAASITPATLTVTPDGSQRKTYGEADPALTYTYSGAASGETPAFTGKLARELGENAGSYAITPGDLALADGEGFNASNYTLAFSDTEAVFTIGKASYGNRTASGSVRFGSSGTVDLSSLVAEGGLLAINLPQLSDPDRVLNNCVVIGETLSFGFVDDSSKVGATATIVVLVRYATNYEEYTITVTVTVDDKLTPTLDGAVTLSPAKITYGQPLSTINITGTMKAGETVVEGTFAWQNPDTRLNAGTHNDIAWTFTPLDTNAYAGASGTATVTVNKAAQSGAVRMASYTYGTAPGAPALEDRTGDPNAAVSYYCAKEGSASTQEWNVSSQPALDAGTYRMYASIAETLNYNRGNADYCEFTVWKAAPVYATKPTGLTAKYGQTLGTVALVNPEGNTPGTWSWQTPETVLDRLGTLSYDANFRPDDTDNYLGVVDVSIQVTVGPADGGSLGTETLTQKYTDGSERTYTPDWSGLPAGQAWSYSSGYSVSAGSSAALTQQDVAADGSSLTYAVSGGAAGDVVTITLKASCSNYEDFTITLVITLTEKDEQAALSVTGGSTVVTGRRWRWAPAAAPAPAR